MRLGITDLRVGTGVPLYRRTFHVEGFDAFMCTSLEEQGMTCTQRTGSLSTDLQQSAMTLQAYWTMGARRCICTPLS